MDKQSDEKKRFKADTVLREMEKDKGDESKCASLLDINLLHHEEAS